MTEAERFQSILDELRALLVELQATGVQVVLVGGQVVSVEAMARGGDGVIEVPTETGVVARRGYSMEPDLLLDVEDAGARGEAIFDVLVRCGFGRVRSYRWRKTLPVVGEMYVDLFVPPGTDESANPGGLTELPGGDVALARARPVRVAIPSGELVVRLPDPAGFIAMKLEAKLRLRPTETKDAFDLYAYLSVVGIAAVRQALVASRERSRLAAQLRRLFGAIDSPGVADVLAAAGPLSEAERALLARSVVDTFAGVLSGQVGAAGSG